MPSRIDNTKPQKDFRKEVESHSSMITNQRIGEIKDAIWRLAYLNGSSKPDPRLRLQFWEMVLNYWEETKDVFIVAIDDGEKIVIDGAVRKGNMIAARMRVYGDLKEMENLYQISRAIYSMINTAMQRLKYFFRMASKTPRGIDAALEMFGERSWEEGDDDGPVAS